MRKFCYLSFLLIFNFYASFAQNISENEMKDLAKEMVTIQVRTNYFKLLNSGANNLPDNYVFKNHYVVFLKYNLNYGAEIEDVKKVNEFNKYDNKFKVFKVYFNGMRTWYMIAFGNDGSYYLLRNFEYNHFNNLIRQKIGRPKKNNEYLNIANLYINTVQFSQKGNRKIVNNSNYKSLKKKFKQISLPKLSKYKSDDILEFYSYQKDTKEIKYHKIVFLNGLVKKVEETLDDR